MTRGVFVAGTDTEIGKTTCAVQLIHGLRHHGLQVMVMKPVASGGIWKDGELISEDAVALQQAASALSSLNEINPYCYEPPISPHLAASDAGFEPDLSQIKHLYYKHQERADIVVVEGAGGWKSPLSNSFDSTDLVMLLKLPVVLVVGLKLGCINHALLTMESMLRSNIMVAGWIGNQLTEDIGAAEAMIFSIDERTNIPLLGVVPRFGQSSTVMHDVIDVSRLINSEYDHG